MTNIYLWEALLALGFCACVAGCAMWMGNKVEVLHRGIQTLHSQMEGVRMKAYQNHDQAMNQLAALECDVAELKVLTSPKAAPKKAPKKAVKKGKN